MKRVVVTGMAAISPLGSDWATVRERLRQRRNAVVRRDEWASYEGLHCLLAAPVTDFQLPEHYTRKRTRSMGRVSLLAVRASELALADAGLLGDPIVTSGETGVAYGSSVGSTDAIADFGAMLLHHRLGGLNASTYLRMMGHTTAVNVALFFQVRGRIVPAVSACTSGSQAIGFACEAIRTGRQTVMIAGGAEELCPTEVAVFDTLYAASTRNATPQATPRPFDCDRDGLVLGEGACTLILEDRDHALARGARIHAEIVGFGTNADGAHVTQPSRPTMRRAMELALEDAGLPPQAVGYVSAHGTGTRQGDEAESWATWDVYGERTPVSTLKSYTGHTLGACGALEAWVAIEMMREGWFHPNLNLEHPDPACAPLDYLTGGGRKLDCEVVASHNFAFGGINTALILRRPP
ncbi:3-oxoacyl-[acyl-carrier-protein] synthase II [Methylomarinovum tepidoasis]|uniref:3-oxoacyl-[acyl-carrier-protein] synthase II n=1 Tax=Methylomarinovum tepidoasis TaxID=2840183 RepID=A0AAU9CKB2_9GAMM|nr:beta-ketoacyl-ACP synthase [Methylomarinovum sp. IN45]BCX89871.1 3-oxoacyl-[acyl-carrier-protein] synthase II [Methylomarinovum sp. IN45]